MTTPALQVRSTTRLSSSSTIGGSAYERPVCRSAQRPRASCGRSTPTHIRDSVKSFDAHDEVVGQAKDIIYLSSNPEVDFPDPEVDILTPAFRTKATYWEAENEFRIIAKEGADASSAATPCHQGYVRISSTALVGLILGCQMKPADRAEVTAIVRAAKHKVRIYNALLEEDTYSCASCRKRNQKHPHRSPVSLAFRGPLHAGCLLERRDRLP